MVRIDAPSSLDGFRKFIIASTCSSFVPSSYLDDYEVFPERDDELGSIYVEAADKVTLKKLREITFVNARDVFSVLLYQLLPHKLNLVHHLVLETLHNHLNNY